MMRTTSALPGKKAEAFRLEQEDDMIIEGFKVLLVDDDPAVLSVLQWALQDLGCRTAIAHGGKAALVGLCRENFDVMITDLIMPDLDGVRLIQKARALDASMKIIVMTGSPELLPRIHCAGAGIDGFMIKPFGINTLKEALWKCAQAKESPVPRSWRVMEAAPWEGL